MSGLEIYSPERLWNEIHPLEMKEFVRDLNKSRFLFPCEFINESVGKLIPPEIMVIYGLGGSYKSQFVIDQIAKIISKEGERPRINLISLEETRISVARKLYYAIYDMKHDLSNLSVKQFCKAVEKDLIIYDDRHSIDDIESLVETHDFMDSDRKQMLFIDSLSRIQIKSDEYVSEVGRDGAVMDRLDLIAKKNKIIIILIHHANKNGDFRGSQRIHDVCRFMLKFERRYIEEEKRNLIYVTWGKASRAENYDLIREFMLSRRINGILDAHEYDKRYDSYFKEKDND